MFQLLGWLFGAIKPEARGELGLATAARNFGAALAPATNSFDDPKIITMIIVGAIVCVVVLIFRRRKMAAATQVRPRSDWRSRGAGGKHYRMPVADFNTYCSILDRARKGGFARCLRSMSLH